MDKTKKKIAVLTQPLGKNYGGMLQAYALQKVLKNMGHEVLIVDRRYSKKDPEYLKKAISVLKRSLARVLLFKPMVVRIWPTNKELDAIYQHNRKFLDQHVKLTEAIDSQEGMDKLRKYNFDAYVVGSDQVWRPKYSPYIPNFFLNFLGEDRSAKRIAYAASFGVDALEYSDEELALCVPLAQKFDAISVREDSAVDLCREHFQVEASHVLDPTLLLDAADFISLVEHDKIGKSPGKLMSYVLDNGTDKKEMIRTIAREKNLTEFSVFPESRFYKVGSKGLSKCVYPPVTAWIRGFMDADYIVTDSFHGTAFSILFNKPFIAIGNKSRGLSRFTSVLNLFGLADRLVVRKEDLTAELIHRPIDFDRVNLIRDSKKAEALAFLRNALGKD